MLKRARNLAKSLGKVSGDGEGRPEKRLSPADFSLSGSELSRVISYQIGRGASCGLLQQGASAAVKESGAAHVSRSGLASPFLRFVSSSLSIIFAYSNKARAGLPSWELPDDDPTI